jgi:hypothetical protein
LKNGKSKPDGTAPVFVQIVRSIELFADVSSDVLVENGLLGRQIVGDSVGESVGKEGLALHRHEFLLDHPAHDVARVYSVRRVAWFPLEPVTIQQ